MAALGQPSGQSPVPGLLASFFKKNALPPEKKAAVKFRLPAVKSLPPEVAMIPPPLLQCETGGIPPSAGCEALRFL